MSLNTPKPPTVKSLILLGLRVGGPGLFGLKAIRNRQAASSTLALGSKIWWVQPVRSTRKRIQTLLKVCGGDDHVHYLCYLLTDRRSGQGNASHLPSLESLLQASSVIVF